MASIKIWKNKAYIPSNGIYKNGIFTNIEPVHVVNLDSNEILPIVHEILITEPKLLSDPTSEELKYRKELLPRLTGARSWKKLCALGYSYSIEKTRKSLFLQVAVLDSKGRWIYDPDQEKIYTLDTDLKRIVQDLLDDLSIRSS
jgi:hypothetical protein